MVIQLIIDAQLNITKVVRISAQATPIASAAFHGPRGKSQKGAGLLTGMPKTF